jgi:hypothetical protein
VDYSENKRVLVNELREYNARVAQLLVKRVEQSVDPAKRMTHGQPSAFGLASARVS